MSDNTPDDELTSVSTSDRTSVTTSAISSAYKVLGQLDDPTGVGVLGHNTSTTGTAYGVEGVTDSADTEAVGVYGNAATAASNATFGVVGTTASDHNLAAGVFGDGSQAIGVRGISAGDDGVFGLSYASGAAGVYGESKESSGSSTNGVRGIARSDADGTAGVKGESFATSGATYGVYGSANSADGYGLYSADDARVDGSVSVGSLGAEVTLGTTQTLTSTSEIVRFDTVVTDDLNEYSTTTGKWTATNAGTYLVTAQIEWNPLNMSAGEGLFINLYLDGTRVATNFRQSGGSAGPSMNLSKTIRNVAAGDTVSVWAQKNSSDDMEIYGDSRYTWFEISRIG